MKLKFVDIPVKTDPTMPKNEVRLVQGRKVIGKILFDETPDASMPPSGPGDGSVDPSIVREE